MTGQQLMIISSGYGAYRVNAESIGPTKSRVILGGIPVHLICLNKRPKYKTPLLINCCDYKCPFNASTTYTMSTHQAPTSESFYVKRPLPMFGDKHFDNSGSAQT
mmetsp:Transcript_5925/g.5346  ORF Transcript_5925/g.5346 Transcript_5925/m.5346 type:complete len:105 (-) Transcript_5925:234-548(-)